MTSKIYSSLTQDQKIEYLVAQRTRLIKRLDTGVARIREAEAQGVDVGEWQEFWLKLLRQYESINDTLAGLQPTKPTKNLRLTALELNGDEVFVRDNRPTTFTSFACRRDSSQD